MKLKSPPPLEIFSLFTIVLTAISFCVVQVMQGRSAAGVVFSHTPKPYVYRVLTPTVARILVWILHITPETAFTLVVVFSAVGMFYAMRTLSPVMVAFLATEFVLFLMAYQGKIYDMATGAGFALALGLLQHKQFSAYYVLFAIMVINRETTILLIPLFILYLWIKSQYRYYFIFGTLYQIIAYVVITALIRWYFADVPGEAITFQPVNNMQIYFIHPIATLALLAGLAGILYLVLRDWQSKPVFLQAAFLCIFSPLVVMHILIGYAFEMRVFIEAVPVTALLMIKV